MKKYTYLLDYPISYIIIYRILFVRDTFFLHTQRHIQAQDVIAEGRTQAEGHTQAEGRTQAVGHTQSVGRTHTGVYSREEKAGQRRL